MNTILGELGKSQKFVTLINQIEKEKSPIMLSGLTDVGMVELLTSINEYSKRPILIVTYNEIQAKEILENIKTFTDKGYMFPKKEIVTYDYIAESKDLPYERIELLNKIKEKRKPITVTTIEALTQKLPPKDVLYKNILHFKIGDIYSLDEIKKKLVNLGYVRCDLIEGRGQFSIRGGILDISISEKIGVRIEFWGDEVDSIRNFAIISQRSINTLDKVEIYPAHEYILERPIEDVCKEIRKQIVTDKQEEIIEEDIEQIIAGNYISKIDKYFDCFYSKTETLLDTKKHNVLYLEKQDSVTNKQAEKYVFQYREVNYYKSEIENLFQELKTALKQKKSIYVLVENKEKAKKLKEILEQEEIICKIEEKLDKTIVVKTAEKIVTIAVGKPSAGFENYEINQLVISADELVSGEKKKRKIGRTSYIQV